MRIAIVGLPSSGKTTVYKALTGNFPQSMQEAAVTAVRASTRHILLAAKTHAPVAAVASDNGNFRFVDELYRLSRHFSLPAAFSAAGRSPWPGALAAHAGDSAQEIGPLPDRPHLNTRAGASAGRMTPAGRGRSISLAASSLECADGIGGPGSSTARSRSTTTSSTVL